MCSDGNIAASCLVAGVGGEKMADNGTWQHAGVGRPKPQRAEVRRTKPARARVRQPGLDGVRVHASGAANLPIEALENAYPLRVERYEIGRAHV